MIMERICENVSYGFSYWFNDGNLIITRGDSQPEESGEILDVATHVMPAYEAKGYKLLRADSQKVYDFLKAKGF